MSYTLTAPAGSKAWINANTDVWTVEIGDVLLQVTGETARRRPDQVAALFDAAIACVALAPKGDL